MKDGKKKEKIERKKARKQESKKARKKERKKERKTIITERELYKSETMMIE